MYAFLMGMMVYYSLCWVLSARYLPVAVLRAVISVFNLLLLGSIFIVKYYKIFTVFRDILIYTLHFSGILNDL